MRTISYNSFSRRNLANGYIDLGKCEEGFQLRQGLLPIETRLYGKEHPSTLSSMDSLALSYDDRG